MSSATTSSDGRAFENSAAVSDNAAAISEADRPTNVVFFDGVCGLCNRFVDFVLSRDRRAAIRFAPLQGETARRVVSGEWRVAVNRLSKLLCGAIPLAVNSSARQRPSECSGESAASGG